MPRYAALIYTGYWWSPERRALQVLHRPHPAEGQRLGAPEAVQGQRQRRLARLEDRHAVRLDDRERSRTTAGAYDQRDAAASSSSTRCDADRRKRAAQARK
jgi:argininosuccinate synthase